MLLTGTASALTGAPGSVLMYGLLGLMAWPRAPRPLPAGLERPADRHRHLGSRPGHRPFHHAARRVGGLLVAGRRPLRPARQPHHHVRAERHRRHGAGAAGLVRPLPDRPGQPVLDVGHPDRVDPRHPRRRHRAWRRSSSAVPASSCSPALSSRSCCGSPARVWSATCSPATTPTPTPARSIILLAAAMTPTVIAVEGGMAFARRRDLAADPGGRRPRRRRAWSQRLPSPRLTRLPRPSRRATRMAGMAMGGSGSGGGQRGVAERVGHVGDVPAASERAEDRRPGSCQQPLKWPWAAVREPS